MRTRFLIPVLLIGLVACSSPAEETSAPSADASSADAPSADASSADASSADASSADAIAISVADFMIDPSEIEVAGPTVTFDVTSDGPTPHNFSVRNEGGEILMATADLSVGDNETISAELEPGTYTIFCSLAGHESLGMTGTLTVTGSQGLRPPVRCRSCRAWRREISPREAIGQLAAVTCPWLSRGAIGGEVGRQNGPFLAGTFTR